MKQFFKEVADVLAITPQMTGEVDLTYFMSRIDSITLPDYVPSTDDIVRARQRSTGCTDTSIILDKVKFTLMDMGGQRTERTKWPRVISSTMSAVFFFCAVDEYNIPSVEDKSKSKFEISLQTWKHLLVDQVELKTKSLFVLFNKMDLLEEKLNEDFSSFTSQFPKFKGKETKADVIEFVQKKFISRVPKDYDLSYLKFFNCCALDTELIGKIFGEARVLLLQQKIQSTGLKGL